MRLYIVNFDNGYDYSDNESYSVGVFETFKMAKDYCLSKGYIETDVEGLFKKNKDAKNEYFTRYYSTMEIKIIELNQEFESEY
jgi:hypothetical protein